MARRRRKSNSHWLLKAVILLGISIGIWYLSQHPDILHRKKNASPPAEPGVVQTVLEPRVAQTIPEPEVIPPPKQERLERSITVENWDWIK